MSCIEPKTKFRDKDGYANRWFNGKSVRAHRAAWIEAHGPIPEGLVVMHKCDNPACINIDHLMLGTQADNISDCIEKDRHCRGERHPKAKLTAEDVIEMRRLFDSGEKRIYELVEMFSVSQALVSAVVYRKHWRHI